MENVKVQEKDNFVKIPTVGQIIASWILKNYDSPEAKDIAERIEKGECFSKAE